MAPLLLLLLCYSEKNLFSKICGEGETFSEIVALNILLWIQKLVSYSTGSQSALCKWVANNCIRIHGCILASLTIVRNWRGWKAFRSCCQASCYYHFSYYSCKVCSYYWFPWKWMAILSKYVRYIITITSNTSWININGKCNMYFFWIANEFHFTISFLFFYPANFLIWSNEHIRGWRTSLKPIVL